MASLRIGATVASEHIVCILHAGSGPEWVCAKSEVHLIKGLSPLLSKVCSQ